MCCAIILIQLFRIGKKAETVQSAEKHLLFLLLQICSLLEMHFNDRMKLSQDAFSFSLIREEYGGMNVTKEKSTERELLEARYERYKKVLKDLTIMSDVFMRNVFKKWECTEYVLQVIMGRKDLRIIDQVLQKDYKNLQGRSVILDCVVRDAEGKQMDVEFQQDNEGASPKRARYHSGMMDMNTLNSGEDFEKLPETYVIFITKEDALGYGLPIYHIDRTIKELDKDFQDEAHIIYVNSKKQEDTELGKLMHDLHCKNAEEMHSSILAERVRELKETERGVEVMCREMEQIYSEGMENGIRQGQIETLAGLVMDGKLDIKTAAASSGMTEQEFQAEMEKLKR